MKKLYFLLVAFMISQNLFAIEKTWTRSTSTDWANVGNWSPSGVPKDTDFVKIVNRANMPVILSGTIATCYGMNIEGASTLTINSGGTLTILPTNATVNNKGINIFSSNIISNQGIINFTGSNYFIVNPSLGLTINNSGTIYLKSGFGLIAGSATVNNLACGKFLMLGRTYENNSASSITTNSGLIIAEKVINSVGNFTNTGILKYNTLTGTVTNSTNSVVVNNTTPIFTYSGTYNGTINGIFTDSLATVSAGTFAAPNTFTTLAALPKTSQRLFAKITPSGGVCSYIVPFTYNNVPSSTKDLSNIVKLHQNRPNPFSQETIISFDLIETNKAVLTLFDINGRQILTSNKDFNRGYNEVILDKSIFKNAGTYFYHLTTDKYAVVKKLRFVKE